MELHCYYIWKGNAWIPLLVAMKKMMAFTGVLQESRSFQGGQNDGHVGTDFSINFLLRCAVDELHSWCDGETLLELGGEFVFRSGKNLCFRTLGVSSSGIARRFESNLDWHKEDSDEPCSWVLHNWEDDLIEWGKDPVNFQL